MQREPESKTQARHLPQQFTSFVGREKELAEIGRLLTDPYCRLVTLVGPGGMGKTRLAIRATVDFAHQFPAGAYFVNLQPVRTEEFLISAIAGVLGVPLSGQGSPLELIHAHLANQKILLTLDNFEQLAEASSLLSALLEGTSVKLLLTSRETLNLHEECVFPLGGMPVPQRGAAKDQEPYGAVQLFVERARRVRPDFSLEQEVENVVAICRLVQGMPLAIELAAPWIKTLNCGEILAEIENNRDLLVTRLRNVPERHRSMQAVFSQTWASLSEDERQVFRRLSVFRGGFLREAAATVAGATLPLLTQLLDKSLLHWESDESGTGRYQIHELLRQFAEDKLQAYTNEVTQVMALHGRTYAQFVDLRADDLLGGRQQAAMVEIEAELNNIRAAWQWAIEQKEMAIFLQIGNPLITFYWYQTRFQEAKDAYARTVECLETIPAAAERDLILAAMLTNLSWFEMVLGKWDYGVELAKRSLALYQQYDAPPFPGLDTDPRLLLGLVYRFSKDDAETIACLKEVLAETERRPNLTNQQTAHRLLAQTYHYGNQPELAKEHVLIASALADELEDQWGRAYNLETLGRISLSQGNYETAEQYLLACYNLQTELEFKLGRADVCLQLTDLALRRKECELARRYAEEGLDLYQTSKTLYGELGMMARLAHVALLNAEHESVRQQILSILEKGAADPGSNTDVKLYTVAIAADMRLQMGDLSPWIDWLAFTVSQTDLFGIPLLYAEELYKKHRERLESAQLDEIAHHVAELSLETIQAELRMDFIKPFAVSQPHKETPEIKMVASANQALVEPLTNRELEVLQLIASGLTNRQIADELFISTGTVKYYSSHIYGKLGVDNRTHAAAVAREKGLIND